MPRRAIRPTDRSNSSTNGPSYMELITTGLNSIIKREHSELVFSELYQAVDKITGGGQEGQLTQMLTQLVVQCYKGWLEELQKQTGNPLITLFSTQVDSLNIYIRIIPKIFSPYDTKISQTKPDLTSRKIIRDNFYNIIYTNSTTMDSVASTMLSSILSFRKRTDTDYSIVKNLVKLFYDFRDYPQSDRFQLFINSLQEETAEFYAEYYATTYVGKMVEFLDKSQEMLDFEKKMDDYMFEKQEADGIRLVAFSSTISSNEDDFFTGTVPPISQALTNESLEPLKWLLSYYNEFSIETNRLIDTLTTFVMNQMLSFKQYFLPPEPAAKDAKKAPAKKPAAKKASAKKADAEGGEKKEAPKAAAKKEGEEDKAKAKKTVSVPENVKHMEELIHLVNNLAKNFNAVFSQVKGSHDKLEEKIKEAWNCKEFNVATNFVIFIDYHLKNEMKYLDQKDIEQFPQICKEFVARTIDKTPFAIAYENYLLRRIIKQGEKNKKIEEAIIKEIRKVIQEFIKAIDKYYNQVKNSKELLDKFISDRNGPPLDIQFNPIILNNSDFQLEKEEVKLVPQFLHDYDSQFTSFYVNQHPNTKLTMLADLSIVEFRFAVPPNNKCATQRTYTVSCDVICGSILNTIAQNKVASLVDIYQAINFKHEEIKGYIKRLCAKERQLIVRIKDPNAKDDKVLKETDKFQLNPKFFYKTVQVQIPPIDKNTEKIKKDTNKNKDIIMKAAGVRILKQRNIVTRTELENEILQQASQFFKPSIDAIRTIINLLQFDTSETFCEELPDGRLKYIR